MTTKLRCVALALLAVVGVGCSAKTSSTTMTPTLVSRSGTSRQTVDDVSREPSSTATVPGTPTVAPSRAAAVATSAAPTSLTTSRPASPATSAGSTSRAAAEPRSATTTDPTRRIPAPTPPTTGGAVTAAFPVCPSVASTDYAGLVRCLRRSVSDFWSAKLNQVIDQPVVVEPTAAQVPARCRIAMIDAPAFTCQVNDTVYINSSLIDLIGGQFGRREVPYAVASVVAHEIGHVVQAAVRQPGYHQANPSDAASQRIEQQADCLSGVWAYRESSRGALDRVLFLKVAKALISDVSSNPEVATHGTPDQRAAAVARGLRLGRPQDCALATFS